jgi:hypothetical protein
LFHSERLATQYVAQAGVQHHGGHLAPALLEGHVPALGVLVVAAVAARVLARICDQAARSLLPLAQPWA